MLWFKATSYKVCRKTDSEQLVPVQPDRMWRRGRPLKPADDQVCLIRSLHGESGGRRKQETRRNSSCSPFPFHYMLFFASFSLERKESSLKRGNEDEFQRKGRTRRCRDERDSFDCGTVADVKHVQATFTAMILGVGFRWCMVCRSSHMWLNHTSDYS